MINKIQFLSRCLGGNSLTGLARRTERCFSTLEPDALYATVTVEVRSAEPAVLKSYEWFATTAAKHLGITVGRCWAPPKPHHNRFTLLKSIHIYKKHRVQYEIRTYFRHMTFEKVTGSTADTFLEYIQRNLPEGVAMTVTKEELIPLPESIQKISKALNKQEA
nr:EOG090X0GP9 [Leptodora kindtii]